MTFKQYVLLLLLVGVLAMPLIFIITTWIFEKFGNYKFALKLHRLEVRFNKFDIQPQLNLARSLVKNNLYDEAINKYKTIIRSRSGNPVLFKELAETYIKNKESAKAIDTYNALLLVLNEQPEYDELIADVREKIKTHKQSKR